MADFFLNILVKNHKSAIVWFEIFSHSSYDARSVNIDSFAVESNFDVKQTVRHA